MRMLRLLRELDGKGPAVLWGGGRRQPLLLSCSVDLPQGLIAWELTHWRRRFILNAHSSDILDLDHHDSTLYSIAADGCIKIWQPSHHSTRSAMLPPTPPHAS